MHRVRARIGFGSGGSDGPSGGHVGASGHRATHFGGGLAILRVVAVVVGGGGLRDKALTHRGGGGGGVGGVGLPLVGFCAFVLKVSVCVSLSEIERFSGAIRGLIGINVKIKARREG